MTEDKEAEAFKHYDGYVPLKVIPTTQEERRQDMPERRDDGTGAKDVR